MVAHLSVLGRLNPDKRRIINFRNPPEDLSLATARAAMHQYIGRPHTLANLSVDLAHPVLVPHCLRHDSLGLVLRNDVFVKLLH